MIANEICDKLCRLGLAGVCGDDVNTPGGFVKGFTGLVQGFGFALPSDLQYLPERCVSKSGGRCRDRQRVDRTMDG